MSNNFIVRDFGRKLLDSAPNNSVLMLHGDLASIPATFVPCNFSLDIVVIVITSIKNIVFRDCFESSDSLIYLFTHPPGICDTLRATGQMSI